MRIRTFGKYLATFINAGRGSRFRQNVIKIARANIVAQSLPLLAAPLLTRLFLPSEFAAAALFVSASGILIAVATWRFEWSVPNASSRTQAAGLLVLGGAFLLANGFLAALFILFFRDSLSFWNGASTLDPFLMLIPLAVIGGGLSQLLQSWFVREADLTAVGNARIARSISNTGLNLSAGLAGLGARGMIFSGLASTFVLSTVLLTHAGGIREAFKRLRFNRLTQCLYKFSAESTLSSIVSLANASSLLLFPLLLAQYYPASEVGLFALMQRVALYPIRIISGAVAQGFWAEAARLVREDRGALRLLYLESTRRLTMFATPIAVICLFGPLYVGPIFGTAHWCDAGFILAALTPMIFSQVIVSPLSHLVVHRKQAWQLVWDIVRFLLLIVTINIASRAGMQIATTILCVSTVMFLAYVILFFLNLKCIGVPK